MLKDLHQRHIHKLRLSLIDACNMRCFYCIPKGCSPQPTTRLSSERITEIVETLVEIGIDEIRLTGGEPLLHPQFDSFVRSIGKMNLKKFGVTTNGVLLKQKIALLKEYNCRYVNISLDSIDRENFNKITGNDQLSIVIDAIDCAIEAGLAVKLNCVQLKGINDHELVPLIQFAATRSIPIRFLELMKIGEGIQHFKQHFISAPEVIARLKESYQLQELVSPIDSTSINYSIPELHATVGFIASESQHFCGNCSRLRLDSTGLLRPCLMTNEGAQLEKASRSEIIESIDRLIHTKPLIRPHLNKCSMNRIGG